MKETIIKFNFNGKIIKIEIFINREREREREELMIIRTINEAH